MQPRPDTDLSAQSIDSIIQQVAADQGGPPVEDADPLAVLSEKLDLLIADAGKWNEYKAASTEYIKEFTIEVRWHRRIRLAAAVFCGALIFTFITCLILAVLLALREPSTNAPADWTAAIDRLIAEMDAD